MAPTTESYYGNLNVTLNVGYPVNGNYTRQLLLHKGDAISEEVFTTKNGAKPYTWIGNLITIGVHSIGGVEVGAPARAEFLKNKSVVIPKVVLDMPLSDTNTMLLEVHRRLWQNKVPAQQIVCKFCTKSLVADIDLDRITLDKEDAEKVIGEPIFSELVANLPVPFSLAPVVTRFKKENDSEMSQALAAKYNRLIFRIPTLKDAIFNEDYSSKNLLFWRRIALDCLTAIQEVDDNGNVVSEFPIAYKTAIGLDLFNYIEDPSNLREIRKVLQTDLPTTKFHYSDTCPCDLKREIPFAMEASRFFST